MFTGNYNTYKICLNLKRNNIITKEKNKAVNKIEFCDKTNMSRIECLVIFVYRGKNKLITSEYGID